MLQVNAFAAAVAAAFDTPDNGAVVLVPSTSQQMTILLSFINGSAYAAGQTFTNSLVLVPVASTTHAMLTLPAPATPQPLMP